MIKAVFSKWQTGTGFLLSLWKARFLSGFLGMLSALALPPIYAQPFLLIAFPGLFLLLQSATKKSSFWLGWWFGFGYFTLGLYWIAFALGVEIERFWWLVPFTVFGLPSLLACFTGLATMLFSMMRSHFSKSLLSRILILCIFLSLSEWGRGHVMTGFPWNLLGYSWAWSLAFSQAVAYVGSYGLTLLTYFIACAPLFVFFGKEKKTKWIRALCFVFALLAVWCFGKSRLSNNVTGFQDHVGVRLVQPSIPQKIKWQRERRAEIFDEMMSLSRLPSGIKITHVIWPEASLPFFALDSSAALENLSRLAPKEGSLILGLPRRGTEYEGLVLRNAAVSLGHHGEVQDFYDKQHLVPFGEYIPLRALFPGFIKKITAGGIDYSAGQGNTVLSPTGVSPARPLICYEGIFPGEVISSGEDRPGWLLSLTNDGWFGRSSGPYQHFQMTRFRAIEEGLPLVRVANNGISGVIDPVGRIMSTLSLDERGVLDSPLPSPLSHMPPYARFGDKLFFALLFFISILSVIRAYLKGLRFRSCSKEKDFSKPASIN